MSDEVTTPSRGLRRAAVAAGVPGTTREKGGPVLGRPLRGTIVCVIDDEEGAETAIEIGKRLAERFHARMLLVSVTEGVGGIHEGVSARQAEAGAKRLLERLSAEHDVADEEQRIAAGDPAEAVARIAVDEAADVIVVGARRGLRARTLRSLLATDLAATASCPVVVAPPRSRTG